MSPETALLVTGVVTAVAAGLWAALLALGEEAAFGETLHTLGDTPAALSGATSGGAGRVRLHRALHMGRLVLL
ncbi:MAG: hypothetical protein ACREMV_08700, partial [Gemmatimonadales bacterium]